MLHVVSKVNLYEGEECEFKLKNTGTTAVRKAE